MNDSVNGMMLVDWLAGHIVTGLVANRGYTDENGINPEDLASFAYEIAMAMEDESKKIRGEFRGGE